MKYREYGIENKQVILLLHGGGLSWWNFEEEAKLLEHRFHVVLLILDGHADSDQSFSSIEKNAKELISFINDYFDGFVYLAGGLSLGAQIIVEALSQKQEFCKYAVIESALVIPMKTVAKWIEPSVKMSYPLIKKNWFSKMQFKSLHIREDLFDNYYKDTCKITCEDMIGFLKANASYHLKNEISETKANVLILVGEKEQNKMIHSANILHQKIPNSSLIVLKRYQHGDLSLNHPKQYVKIIRNLIATDET